MDFDIVNPLEIPNWDDLILAIGNASFFYSSSWARVLHEAYGYKPVYFTSFENGRISSLMPFMEVRSWLTGKRGVSLPFTDFCDSVARTEEIFREAVDAARKHGREMGWKTLEWRGSGGCFGNGSPSSAYYTHTIDLADGQEKVFAKFKSNIRRNINKAMREKVRLDIDDSPESIAQYYRLHCGTRKDHGLPPQPFSFFKKIFEHVIRKGRGFTVLAYLEDACIAGAIFFCFGNNAVYKFGASDKRHQHLRPNNLVMWEAIKWYADRSFRVLSLGRTGL